MRPAPAALAALVALSAFAACGSPRPPPAVDSDAGIIIGAAAPDPSVCAYVTSAPPPSACTPVPGSDEDGDGFSVADGDCDDHDCAVNPGAYDWPGNRKDEDCSGVADDEITSCDQGVTLEGNDPAEAARALGICRTTTEGAVGKDRRWGLVSARWVLPDGASERDPLSRGLLPSFGAAAPREGSRMVALSSGVARAPNQPGWRSPAGYDKQYLSGTPQGYPKAAPACPGVITGAAHDGAALEVVVRVPTNARGLAFDQLFYTFEYPDYVCSPYNDYFVAMLSPPVAGLPDGNIAFDQRGNPVSVNNSLLYACKGTTTGGKSFTCPLGTAILSGTGYEASAATGWITTRAPVAGGTVVRLLFAVWDSGDGLLDSTVLLDRFAWSEEAVRCAQTLPAGR